MKLHNGNKIVLTLASLVSIVWLLHNYRTDPGYMLAFYIFGASGFIISAVNLWRSE